MSTRRDIPPGSNNVPTGFEGNDVPNDIEIPSCSIEDVDRAVFNLFDKQLPMQVRQGGNGSGTGTRKVPVIFATGERFAFLRRKIPLGDRGGDHSALIIPLISITRSAISQEPDNGISGGQTEPIVIKRRLSKDSPIYKRLINEYELKNQDEVFDQTHNLPGLGSGSNPGTAGSRRAGTSTPDDARQGKLLRPHLSNNIYETLTIPPVKYYTATYNITIWTQYTQEMNDLLMVIMSLYQNNHKRTFKLETSKGYWFVGYVGSDLTAENNSDDFTDAERLIKYNFDMKVNAYIVAPKYQGSPAYIRRYVSAPTVEFNTFATQGKIIVGGYTPRSGDPNKFVLEDVYSETNEDVGSGVAANTAENVVLSLDSHTDRSAATVGGYNNNNFNTSARTVVTSRNIFTGAEQNNILTVKSVNSRKGETVFREQQIFKIDDFDV
jgi:hypothetical protein